MTPSGPELLAGQRVISRELYHEIYPAICAKLDPKRYYHIDSPYGGDFPNDPLKGDTQKERETLRPGPGFER